MGRVTEEDLREALRFLADEIERGRAKSATLKWITDDEGEQEHTFSLETEEERTAALLAIRTFLGQVH